MKIPYQILVASYLRVKRTQVWHLINTTVPTTHKIVLQTLQIALYNLLPTLDPNNLTHFLLLTNHNINIRNIFAWCFSCTQSSLTNKPLNQLWRVVCWHNTNALNLLARVFQPPLTPLHSRNIKENLFSSDDQIEHYKNLPMLLLLSFNLKTLPPSFQSKLASTLSQLAQQSSTLSNNQARSLSLNLIQEEKPRLVSTIKLTTFPLTISLRS